MSEDNNRYLTFMGKAPKDIPHWEHWSCPDAATYITGIDYYEESRSCMQKMNEIYPKINLSVPEGNKAIQHPENQEDKSKGRWGH